MFDPLAVHGDATTGGIAIGNLATGEATATPTANKLVLFDANGNLPGSIASAASATYAENGCPIGTIIAHAANTPPTRWLECNGSAVSRTTYSALFTVIGTTFGTGDGTTTFNLPDLRGEFIRGWDNSRGIDSSRTFASFQNHQFQDHRHSYAKAIPNIVSGTTNIASGSSGGITTESLATGNTLYSNTGNYGTETRPRNIALMYCIKY
jgi:microcystin-dependent protein